MSLQDEISAARKLIFRDGYDMSIGEIIGLYDKNELVINPEYQRLFRWTDSQKTRFIESILLNIPIPPIFVFTTKSGKWELVDGLQRVSTLLQFTRVLKDTQPFVCDGTNLLPSLAGMQWPTKSQQDEDNTELPDDVLKAHQQLALKRSRLRVEILGPETDSGVKFELFQRLNTGGSNLSEQEIRNCVIVSIRPGVLNVLKDIASQSEFIASIPLGGVREERQYPIELALRVLVYRNFKYNPRFDVHEYLDKSVIAVCSNEEFPIDEESELIKKTFVFLSSAFGNKVFYKNDRFSLAYFEFITLGVSRYLEKGGNDKRFIKNKILQMQNNSKIDKNTGAGVRGTQRLSNIIFGMAVDYFQ